MLYVYVFLLFMMSVRQFVLHRIIYIVAKAELGGTHSVGYSRSVLFLFVFIYLFYLLDDVLLIPYE